MITTIRNTDIEQFDKHFRTNFINSLTGFKSVALVGTKNQAGKTNLAIFSQIIHVGANPALLGILFRPHTVPRHTLENILDTHAFTVNHIAASFVAQAHHTSARWDVSEFEACGLAPQYSENFSAPYVQQATIKIGMRLVERKGIEINHTILIIGSIEEVILPETVVADDGFVDLEAAGTVTCSGLDTYHTTSKIARFDYAKPDRHPSIIS